MNCHVDFLESRQIDCQYLGLLHQKLPTIRSFQHPYFGSAYFATVSQYPKLLSVLSTFLPLSTGSPPVHLEELDQLRLYLALELS